jgi:type I restriction enzyme S subunit
MTIRLPDHLDLIASTPEGIKKLRGLILELAVCGKLVPQGPDDEPASELLKRIAKERARLELEGICKKSKATPLNGEDAPPFELPTGWALSQLSDLALVLNGRAYSKDELLSEGIPVLRVGNLFTSNHWYYSNLQLEEDKYCDKGDLLYSWSASFGPFIWQGPKVIYHYHIWKLRLFDELSLSKEYFYKFLLEKTAEIKAAGHGVSMIHMTKEKMEKILVPLPPLAEQHRIVAKVDELMTLCDRLEQKVGAGETAHAKLVDTLLGTLTQSTDAAELAANWQRLAEHFDTLFTTESSLDALKQTVLQLATSGMLLTGSDFHKWPEGTLGDVVARSEAGWSPQCEAKAREGNGWGVLKVSAVSWDDFDPAQNKALPSHLQPRPEYEVRSGDFLISRANTAELVAKSVVVRQTPSHLMLSDKTIRLHFKADANPRFFCFANNAPFAREYYARIAGGTSSSMKNVSRQQILALPVTIPPLPEQHRIVAKVDELMTLCDRLKADLAESRTRQARLSATLIESALQAA